MSRQPNGGSYRNMSNGSNPPVSSGPPAAMASNSRLTTPSHTQLAGRPGSSNAQSRAERFEDEKRRIIESCFSKLDANGQLSESYITHIRITEDAAYPSTPAPPESTPENKKPRLIIIAVRSTGRVRMHKARENNNGSFSIGKTWNLEELSAIESFSEAAGPPQDERERQYRSWAGSVGFVVTISKPYYWQAGTAKEKDFFIASAVKIYRKYTKGMVPELRGFDEREKGTIMGAPVAAQQPPQGPPTDGARLPSEGHEPAPPQPPFAAREQGRDGSRYRGSPGPPGSSGGSRVESPARPPPGMQQYRQGRVPSGPRPYASTDQMQAGSREHSRPGSRPDTAPGHRGVPFGGAAPMPGQFTAQQQPSYSQLRSESPAASVPSPRRDPSLPTNLQPRQQSPPRQRNNHRPVQDAPQNQAYEPSPPPTAQPAPGAVSGAGMLAATRQRWAAQQQQPSQERVPSRGQPPAQRQLSGSELPPLETMASRQRPEEPTPQSAQSQVSSAGIDPSEAAAVGAMSSYWGPESTSAAPSATPVIQEPGSPPTPERSKRRPTMDGRPSFDSRPSYASGDGRTNGTNSTIVRPGHDTRPSYNSAELRPQPLKQSARQQEMIAEDRPSTARATPEEEAEERPPEPPAHRNKDVGLGLDMPGAFASSPAGPSPLPTPGEEPAETPATEQPPALAEIPAPEQPTAVPDQETPEEERAAYRPGLGPMFKKKGGAAEKFKKAAFAAGAFKPRPGGAAERILKAKAEREGDGLDEGVSGFVPRPQAAQEPAPNQDRVATPTSPKPRIDETPKLEVSSPPRAVEATEGLRDMDGAEGVQLRDASPTMLQPPSDPDAQEKEDALLDEQLIRQPQVKTKRRSLHQEKYLADLGIDRSLLEGRGLEFEGLLEDFGWKGDVHELSQLNTVEADLRQELGRVEAGSWLSHTDAAREERVVQVESLLDRVIAECDELEGLLTIYGVELGSLSEDVAYIEAQSQGLQVQSANQKLLHTELTGLVETMSLSRDVIESLRHGDLSSTAGLEEVEAGLVKLYLAMVTMDPSIRSSAGSRPKSRLGADGGGDLSRMAALQEKKDVYEREAKTFCQRTMQQLDYLFTTSLNNAKAQSLKPSGGAIARLNKDAFVLARTGLWMYSPIVLFVKDLNPPTWQTMMRLYYSHAKQLYQDSFKQNIDNWKRAARKPTGDETELLFTTQEKEGADGGAGLSSTARKLTVKRSQTLAKSLRNASGDKPGSPTESRAGSLMPCEVFAGAMDEMAPLISQEQNFVVDFFHVSSLETGDFVDAVGAATPEQRRGTSLLQARSGDPDREMARRLTGVVGEIFEFFPPSTSALLDWALAADPIQGVGILASISKHSFYLSGSSQEFILQLLDQLATRLQTLWAKFVDEQIRAIEETKVKISKRKGVLRFMKVFPHFSAGVENVFAAVARGEYDGPAPSVMSVRMLVDDAYARINHAMFDSLKVIAKESPTAPGAAGRPALAHTASHAGTSSRIPGMVGAEEQADKAMLNYHVLMIENMHHYVEEVDDGGREGVLAEWRGRAMVERGEALEAYVSRVVRRPLAKLLDFIESVENEIPSHRDNPAKVAQQSYHSRKAAREHFKKGDAKDIRQGIFELLKRVEKHFAGSDEESISRPLVAMVVRECERSYERVLERMEALIREVWPSGVEGEKEVVPAFGKEDLRVGFGGRR